MAGAATGRAAARGLRASAPVVAVVATFAVAGCGSSEPGAPAVSAEPAGTRSAQPFCLGRKATIVGRPGSDRIRGTRGTDVIVARGGRDRISGRGGKDLICAGGGNDRIRGGGGNDQIDAGGGSDRVSAGAGDRDYLIAGPGNDRYDGGAGGIDLISFEGARAGVEADLAAGRAGGEGRDRLRRLEAIYGGDGGDLLSGGPQDNLLLGFDGDDTLIGGAGNDYLDGGRGEDSGAGGAGLNSCRAIEIASDC